MVVVVVLVEAVDLLVAESVGALGRGWAEVFFKNANRATKSECFSVCRLYVERNSYVSRHACVAFGENVCI